MPIDVTDWEVADPTLTNGQKQPHTEFETFWRGQNRRIEVQLLYRSNGGRWMLLQTESSDGIWVVTSSDSRRLLSWNEICEIEEARVGATPEDLREVAQKAIVGQAFRLGRLFFSRDSFEGKDLGFVVWQSGEAICLVPRSNWHSAAAFRLPGLDDFDELTNEAIRSHLAESLNDPDSDLVFAANWLFAWEDDRYRMLYPIYDQLRDVMKWVLMSCPDIGVIETKWRWRLHPYDPEQCSLFNYNFPPVQPTLSADFHHWQTLLCERIAASVPQELVAQHPCVEELLQSRPEVTIIAKVDPSAHEQLEAHFKLREWFSESR